LHSACLEIKDSGVLISARTDTGKTGTILRLLREHRARFLSDDMTILAPSGVAISYPKPLTISHHTLLAVNIDDELSRREGGRLRIQSRVHSREGRRLGMMLGRLNLPIMSINAITQLIISPPKYPVDRLVSCQIIEQSTARDIVFISRGSPTIASVPHEIALGQLIENTDDAYGFPPFRQFAPALVLGGHDYAELRRMEQEILAAALTRMRVHAVTSNNFSWADEIPHVIGTGS
jgi:hypothetical protein